MNDAPDPSAIRAAAELIRAGRLVAFPTETVYGLGADATNDRAVAAIFEAKGRPRFNPLIVHVPDLAAAERLAVLSPTARLLARRFWPGPLTLVLARRTDSPVSHLASAGLDTIALRVPAHPMARALLAEAARPIAAPSANRAGTISPTTAQHVADSLGARVDMILDGGPCRIGIESTVLDVSGDTLMVLRPGGVTASEIAALAGPVARHSGSPSDESHPASPGLAGRHYAPRHRLRLNADAPQPGEALLSFGPNAPATNPAEGMPALNLSKTGDLTEAAANLFAMLRALDAANIEGIAVMPIPTTGLGEAINDRLARAAE